MSFGLIYKAAAAAINAPMAPATEPASMLAALVEAVIGADEVEVEPEAEPVDLEVVLRPPVPVAEVVPLSPVGVAVVGAIPVPEALPMPLPAPSDGDKPPPDDARTDPVATD